MITLSSKDVDPIGSEMVARYEKAMSMKAEGKDAEVEKLLLPSVEPPSIYHGHYRELFIVWRKEIRKASKAYDHQKVVQILTRMLLLNTEMIMEMSRYWSLIHGVERTPEYFRSYSKVNKTDVAMLKKHALRAGDNSALDAAENYHFIK